MQLCIRRRWLIFGIWPTKVEAKCFVDKKIKLTIFAFRLKLMIKSMYLYFNLFYNALNWLQDPELSWFTEEPRLTRCMRQTFLIFVPYLLLWVLTPFEICVIIAKRSKKISWNHFNLARIAICILCIVLQITELASFYDFFSNESTIHKYRHKLADVIAPLLQAFTYVSWMIFLFSNFLCI